MVDCHLVINYRSVMTRRPSARGDGPEALGKRPLTTAHTFAAALCWLVAAGSWQSCWGCSSRWCNQMTAATPGRTLLPMWPVLRRTSSIYVCLTHIVAPQHACGPGPGKDSGPFRHVSHAATAAEMDIATLPLPMRCTISHVETSAGVMPRAQVDAHFKRGGGGGGCNAGGLGRIVHAQIGMMCMCMRINVRQSEWNGCVRNRNHRSQARQRCVCARVCAMAHAGRALCLPPWTHCTLIRCNVHCTCLAWCT